MQCLSSDIVPLLDSKAGNCAEGVDEEVGFEDWKSFADSVSLIVSLGKFCVVLCTLRLSLLAAAFYEYQWKRGWLYL